MKRMIKVRIGKANLRQQDIMHQLVDRQELLLDLKANM